jgi:hypothetical protein
MGISYNPRTITDGLVLCLDAANPKSYPGSGTTWTDLSGRGNNGTLVNGVGYSGDNLGSLSFDGVNDYVNIPNSTDLQVNNFTLEGWVYPISGTNPPSGSGYHIMRKESTFLLSHHWDSGNRVGLWMQRTGGWEPTFSGTPAPLNTWCNVVATYDNSAVRIYFNGDQVASTSKSGQTRVTTTDVLINGTVSNSLPQNYNCSIAKIYNRALTAQEIQQNFNATKSRFL